MEQGIEHAVGVYLLLMAIACLVGVLTHWLIRIPYTIALTAVGLALAVLKIGPEISETGFSKELIFFVLLPPLLFYGALHMQLAKLRRHAVAIGLFATLGVLAATLIVGGITYSLGVFGSLLIAMLFGALICPTDPVSVLAIFGTLDAPSDLGYLVEGESLFNDGTGVVVFTIILSAVIEGGQFHLGGAVLDFLQVSLGGAAVGLGMGAASYFLLRRLNAHLLENMICLLCCYASFFVAEHFHLSGVIGVVSSGILLGNYGERFAMEPETTETVNIFFESLEFLINSLLFILIGLELKAIPSGYLADNLGKVGIAVLAIVVARSAVVYLFFGGFRLFGASYPMKWSHVLNWGGLRGSIPIALLLGLPRDLPLGERPLLLTVGFGVICFSLLGQGLTLKPLMRLLSVGDGESGEVAASGQTSS